LTFSVDMKWYSGSAITARSSDFVVIVDAFRATSMVATLLHLGAEKIVPVSQVFEAQKLKEENPDFLLIGEEGGRMPEGFSYGNSPSRVYTAFAESGLKGRTVVHRSSAGTQSISKAIEVRREKGAGYIILTSSFLNAAAVAHYLASSAGQGSRRLTVICSGYVDKIYSLEDELAAGALLDALKKLMPSLSMSEIARAAYLSFRGLHGEDRVALLRDTRSGRKIIEVGDEEDIPFCVRDNLFDVVPEEMEGAIVRAR